MSTINDVHDLIVEEMSKRGLIIEAGFAALRVTSMRDAPPDKVRDMRMAYFSGAQHLYASIMTVLDAGEEPTEKDMQRMELIHNELERFRQELAELHGRPKGSA